MIVILSDLTNWVGQENLERLASYLRRLRWFSYGDTYAVGGVWEGPLFNGPHYLTPLTAYPRDGRMVSFFNHPQIVNPIFWQGIFGDKTKTDRVFRQNRLPIPDSAVITSHEQFQDFLDDHGMVIIKSIDQCGGAGHFIVSSGQAHTPGGKTYQLKLIAPDRWSRPQPPKISDGELHLILPIFVQDFLLPDKDEVWRAYVVNNKAVFFSIRRREVINDIGDYIINACKGAHYHLVTLEEAKHFSDFIRQTLAVVRLEAGAIDFLVHKGKPYLLEVNCDGIHFPVDREFYHLSGFDSRFDFDLHLARWLNSL